MRIFASLLVLFAACELMAFDSAEWHGKRELFAREAERMRSVYTNCAAHVRSPALNVQIPIETYPNGSVKISVNALKAQYFLSEGLVWAEGVSVCRYSETGDVEIRIDARNCVIDRQSRTGWAEGLARVSYGKSSCQGEGVFFSAPESYVRIFDRTRVESSDLKFRGLMQ